MRAGVDGRRCTGRVGRKFAAVPGQLGPRPAGSDGGGRGPQLQRRQPPTLLGHRPSAESLTSRPPPSSRPGCPSLPPLPPVAHPCALVTVPRAPSRASWGEGVTLITLGRERSGGQAEEPLAAPPSPRVSLQARRRRTRPAPAYSSAAAASSSSSHPHRARPRGGACYGERLALARVRPAAASSARASALPHPARAPTPRSLGFRAGEVGLESGRPNQPRCRGLPLPSPSAPAQGRGLRAGRAARAGPEAGSPGASRASGECRACGRRGWHPNPFPYFRAPRRP